MAKLYVTQASVRPLRWMLRILGWMSVAAGIVILLTGETDSAFLYLPFGGEPLESIGMGAFLVILDLLLPDPDRKARREKRKLEKVYREAYKNFPSGDGLNQLLRQYGRGQLVKQINQSIHFCQIILDRYPCREVLEFIHTYHPEAAYALCAARKNAVTPAAPPETPDSTGTTTIIQGQNAGGNTASRISDINALLAAQGEKTSGTPLGPDNLQLAAYLDPFYHRNDYYDAATHTVRKFVCIPGGPQGFSSITLPKEIRTVEELLPYLEKNHGFHLKT